MDQWLCGSRSRAPQSLDPRRRRLGPIGSSSEHRAQRPRTPELELDDKGYGP